MKGSVRLGEDGASPPGWEMDGLRPLRQRWWVVLGMVFPIWTVSGGPAERHCILVRGALGDAVFEQPFAEMESGWRDAAGRAGDIRFQRVASKEALAQALRQVRPETSEELWLVLVGHGTDDGRTAKFNLEGEDVSAQELAGWLASWTKPLVLINCASASARFLPVLSGKDRIVVTATQSASEVFAPQFGVHLARMFSAPEADLNRDGAVSVLEATVLAADRVSAGYAAANRLATEHALIDDNGDGKGTRADWFEGLRPVKQPEEKVVLDGLRAGRTVLVRSAADRVLGEEQRRRREALERDLEGLKQRRGSMGEAEFFREAERILLELGRLGCGVGGGAEEQRPGGRGESGGL